MNDRYFDLGNFAANNELDADAETALLVAYFGEATPRRAARLALMKIMSDFREAMWGVVAAGDQHARLRLRRLRRRRTSTACCATRHAPSTVGCSPTPRRPSPEPPRYTCSNEPRS